MVNNLPSNAGDSGSIPGWGTKIPHTTGKLSRRAATTRAHVPQLESPHTAREITHAATKACCNQTNESHIKGRLPGSSAGKESACIAGNPGSIPGSGRSPGEGRGYTPQYSWASLVAQRLKCLPRMRETRVQFLGREDPLEKEMAIHSSTLAWRIPWREEPGRLQSTGSQRVGHD